MKKVLIILLIMVLSLSIFYNWHQSQTINKLENDKGLLGRMLWYEYYEFSVLDDPTNPHYNYIKVHLETLREFLRRQNIPDQVGGE